MKQYCIGNILVISISKGLVWFRIFGYGLYFTKLPNFSQRNGYQKTWRIEKTFISPLYRRIKCLNQ